MLSMCVCAPIMPTRIGKSQSSPHYPHTTAADLFSEIPGIRKAGARGCCRPERPAARLFYSFPGSALSQVPLSREQRLASAVRGQHRGDAPRKPRHPRESATTRHRDTLPPAVIASTATIPRRTAVRSGCFFLVFFIKYNHFLMGFQCFRCVYAILSCQLV